MNVFIDTCLLCHSLLWRKATVCSSCLELFVERELIFRQERDLPIFSLLQYVSPVHDLVKAWKDPKNTDLFQILSLELAKKISYLCLLPVCGVVPMPAKIYGQRDHAYYIAESVAEYFKVPLATDFLERRESPLSQKDKSVEMRFDLKMNLVGSLKNHQGDSRALWLFVDDVVTTGSTLVTAWNLLGRPNALGLTLASTPRFDLLNHCN